MSSRALPIAIGVLVLGAVAAATYVLFAAATNFVRNEAGVMRFAEGEMAKLAVLDEPPARPEIIFVNGGGERITLNDFEDKVTLVNIWATWCAPCVHEMPSLDRLQAARGSDRFEVVAISVDRNIEDARAWYAENGIENLGLYQENSLALATALGSPGVPVTVIYSADGREVARLAGGAEWDSEEALALIDEVIAASFPEAGSATS